VVWCLVAKRRANNEGSIFKDSRGYWVAEFVLPDGKKKTKNQQTPECRQGMAPDFT